MCFLFQTFILQLEGKTKWKLFKPLQELPQEASPDLELSDLGEPTDEFDMEVHCILLELCDCNFYCETSYHHYCHHHENLLTCNFGLCVLKAFAVDCQSIALLDNRKAVDQLLSRLVCIDQHSSWHESALD